MDIRIEWMVLCGQAECEAWISTMEEHCFETVEISTPQFIDWSLNPPHGPREVMEYTIDVFNQALDILDSQQD